MSNERRIKSLKTRQKSLLTSFGLIKSFVDGYQEDTGAHEVLVRLDHLVAIWNDFNAMQAELETLDEAAIEAHLKERIEFETSYFRVKGFLLAVNKNEPTSPRNSSSSSLNTQSPKSSHVRLPDIKLPVFAGNLDQWLNFHDLFVSLVHSSHELSNIQKFYYLRSSLSGDALKLVQTIAISANNYQVAWNLLLDHYQNPVRLKQSYVDSLFEFPSVKKESASELHSLVEKFEANVKVLHQLGEKTEYWDILLIRMLSIRLDPTTRRDWEEHASTLNAVSFQNLTTFIQRRVSVLQTIGKTTETPSPINFSKKPVQRVVASHGASPTNQRKCVACSDHHPLYQLSATLNEQVSYASAGHGHERVLLATAVVIVVDDNGTEHAARALLDSGSECCFATETFSQLVKVRRKRIHIPIAGIGQSSMESRFKFLSKIRSRICDYNTTVEFLVLPKVAIDLPSAAVDTSSWEIPPGAEVFFELFKVSGRIQLGPGLPTLINSDFGWVVSGKNTQCPSITPIVANVATVADLNNLMEKFWSLEEDSSRTCYSVEETACEEYFRRTVSRTPEGRYIVSLPLKEDILANLHSNNRRTAIRRFHLLQGQLARNDELCNQYRDFMDEYLQLGHMELVQDYQQLQHPSYHLPHHAVIREDSTTTKVRVVFDASCRTPNGPSLNDALMIGPIVQEDLRSLTMRSRIRPVLLNADVKQMYRQILTDQRSNNLQHIVWSPSPEAPLQTYELKTVTYGTASAPFLATRVLQQLADDEQNDFPEAANVLRKDFYVDDLFSGANTVEEAITLRRQLEALLNRGGFELRKWASNEPAVLENVPTENRALKSSVDLDRDQCIKTLGLHWEPATDVLRYKTQLPPTSSYEALTKRIALSYIARLFDPLGLVGPVVTTAKIFMQAIWTLMDDEGKTWSWDKELPPTFKTR
ncbi:uncharacterized protein LOC135707774 [Ochlerotatus camptorhynchus]|uniref:uncharacterized protein LOC135707774 n=1 Tax=Ochlerotatus camptorhynchus TaxID=644619 RepID=UPI0031D735D7